MAFSDPPKDSSAGAATHRAIWQPAWHELDQSLFPGRHRFFFFHEMPSAVGSTDDQIDLAFFNLLDTTENCDVRFATVLRIWHAQLGDLLRVDTFGLDYILFPVDGEEIVVDAEEEPGSILSGYDQSIEDWSLLVELTGVSDPIGETD